ncbi:MAG: group II intron reverse transcriptase/maturase [Actinobacteria bacterium]|nr:group II intron reverse transcriptase/maturase [Actinomycetota bacterium]
MSVSTGQGKPFDIDKRLIWEAWKQVKQRQGAPGIDGQTIEQFEADLQGQLYKLWNRMSSGSYLPSAVRLVEIPKPGSDQERTLGVPTVYDRVAQTAVAMLLDELVDPVFHEDSYGFRQGRSALDAVAACRQRCWKSDWVIDLDIKGFFDNVPWEQILSAVAHHTDLTWVRLYVQRWLAAPAQRPDGSVVERVKGTPQGAPVSPVLANLFMHYAFDCWMQREHPHIPFERYCDDVIVHCASEQQARQVRELIAGRLDEFGLQLHPDKTRIVYCKDDDRRGDHAVTSFTFLGYTFRPRRAKNRWGKPFVSFLPAVSRDNVVRMQREVRSWHLPRRSDKSLQDLARMFNPIVRGWINYYGVFYKSMLYPLLQHLNRKLAFWATRKYRRLKRRERRATARLRNIASREPDLFAHWRFGVRP